MDSIKVKGKVKKKRITVSLASIKGLGETIKKIEFHRGILFDLTESAKFQCQQIESGAKIFPELTE
jgi:hypothetical protein